jgi:hypothetical protein
MSFDSILNQARKNAAAIQKIAAKLHIKLPQDFPQQIVQLNDCLDTYSAAKVLIAQVVKDATGDLDLAGWAALTSNFDKNWDAFAKEYNEIFNKASQGQQANILETFARNHFGDAVFEAGSIIKNETPQILSGINEFKSGIDAFSGSYRDPVEAANKIKTGVNTIVRSTEKIAKSAENIVAFINKRRGIHNPTANPVLGKLSSLTSDKAVAAGMSGLNIAASGVNVVQGVGTAIDAAKRGDFRGVYQAGRNAYKNAKVVVQEVKNIANGRPPGEGGNPLDKGQINAGGQANGGGKSDLNPNQQTSEESSDSESGKSDSYVCSTAKIKCSCGDKISTLTVLPDRTIWLTGEPQANISDHISMMNIAPFGKCHTVAYPATGSATAANHGKLTPMPCVPNTPFPWMGGKDDVILKGQQALLKSSKLKCMYGGTITITFDGQK